MGTKLYAWNLYLSSSESLYIFSRLSLSLSSLIWDWVYLASWHYFSLFLKDPMPLTVEAVFLQQLTIFLLRSEIRLCPDLLGFQDSKQQKKSGPHNVKEKHEAVILLFSGFFSTTTGYYIVLLFKMFCPELQITSYYSLVLLKQRSRPVKLV